MLKNRFSTAKSTVLVAALTTALILAPVSAAQAQPVTATEPPGPATSTGDTGTASPQLVEQVEELFSRYVVLTDGLFTVDRGAVLADGLEGGMQSFISLASTLNTLGGQLTTTKTSGSAAPAGTPEFAECLIGGVLGVSFATLPGLISAISTGVAAWNWGLVASTVWRIVGPLALRSVGGPVGLAAALAGATGACLPQLWS